MIGKLSGIIDSIEQNHLILDVQGVGYLVFASPRTLGLIGDTGDTASLLIDTHVREDHFHLYGFFDKSEQSWFRLLTSVQGVGAKVGLALLGVCSPEEIQIAIAAQDKAVITRADGVGPKLATRILTELKDKVADIGHTAFAKTSSTADNSKGKAKAHASQSVDQDAVSGLINLGYGRADAFSAVMRVRANEDDAADDLQKIITLALKELSS